MTKKLRFLCLLNLILHITTDNLVKKGGIYGFVFLQDLVKWLIFHLFKPVFIELTRQSCYQLCCGIVEVDCMVDIERVK